MLAILCGSFYYEIVGPSPRVRVKPGCPGFLACSYKSKQPGVFISNFVPEKPLRVLFWPEFKAEPPSHHPKLRKESGVLASPSSPFHLLIAFFPLLSSLPHTPIESGSRCPICLLKLFFCGPCICPLIVLCNSVSSIIPPQPPSPPATMRPLKYSKTALAGSFLLLFSSVSAAILGIDLGQEYIKAALVKPGIPLEIVLTRDSKRKETAAIAFKPNTQATADSKDFNYPDRLYGSDALAVHPRFAADTYPNIKQLLGLTMDDKQLESYTARYPALQIVPSDVRTTVAFKSKSAPKTSGDDEDEEEGKWTVEELLAMQLKNVKKNAEAMAGSVIKDAVFAIPTAFNPEERNALMIAADLAGLRPMAMISDGLAVAINYATTRSFEPKDPPQTHVIYDMGAGSVSATVVRIGGIIVKELGQTRPVVDIAVQGVGVDKSLGGDLYTERLVDYLIDEFIKTPKGSTIAQSEDEARKKIKSDGKAMAKLWKEAGRVRHILSANTEAYASIEALVDDIDFRSNKVLRSTFEELIDETKERIVNPIRHALNVAGVELEKVKSVIIHGGSVRTPFVTKAIEELVGADKISKNVNPDEAAVLGATFHGASLSKSFRVKEMHVHDQTLYPVSIKLHAHARSELNMIGRVLMQMLTLSREHSSL